MLCAIVANFLPVLYLWIVSGEISHRLPACRILSMIFRGLGRELIVQPLSYYGGLGMVGTYISWISGSAADIRLPSINMAQKVTNTGGEHPEGDAIGAMALSASVFTTVGIISVFAVVGGRIIPLLPEVITQSFTYMQPGTLRRCLCQYGGEKPEARLYDIGPWPALLLCAAAAGTVHGMAYADCRGRRACHRHPSLHAKVPGKPLPAANNFP